MIIQLRNPNPKFGETDICDIILENAFFANTQDITKSVSKDEANCIISGKHLWCKVEIINWEEL